MTDTKNSKGDTAKTDPVRTQLEKTGWVYKGQSPGFGQRYRKEEDIERGSYNAELLVPDSETDQFLVACQYEWPVGHFYDQIATQHKDLKTALEAVTKFRNTVWK